MAMRYQRIAVDGAVNSLVLDDGIESTEQEKIRIHRIILAVNVAQDNVVEGYVRQKQEIELADQVLVEYDGTASSEPATTNRMTSLEMMRELAVGERFQVGIRSGGTASSLRGGYEYEVM